MEGKRGRGRPRKDPRDKKDNTLNVRFTDRVYDDISRLSTEYDMTMSEYVRICVEKMIYYEKAVSPW